MYRTPELSIEGEAENIAEVLERDAEVLGRLGSPKLPLTHHCDGRQRRAFRYRFSSLPFRPVTQTGHRDSEFFAGLPQSNVGHTVSLSFLEDQERAVSTVEIQ